jgi:hypothetical protein
MLGVALRALALERARPRQAAPQATPASHASRTAAPTTTRPVLRRGLLIPVRRLPASADSGAVRKGQRAMLVNAVRAATPVRRAAVRPGARPTRRRNAPAGPYRSSPGHRPARSTERGRAQRRPRGHRADPELDNLDLSDQNTEAAWTAAPRRHATARPYRPIGLRSRHRERVRSRGLLPPPPSVRDPARDTRRAPRFLCPHTAHACIAARMGATPVAVAP